jgi:uncharacterized membrane protein
MVAATAPDDNASLLGLSPRKAAALAWGGAWITGGLVAWLAPDGARFVRHHSRHALWLTGGVTALATLLWGLGIVMAFMVTPTAFAVVSWIASGTWVVLPPLWGLGMYRALRGQRIRVPWLTRRIDDPVTPPELPPAPPAAPMAPESPSAV